MNDCLSLYLMSLYRYTSGKEGADCQAEMAQAFHGTVGLQGVEVVVLQGHGAHGQAGEEEHQIYQAEGQQQLVEHGGHHLPAQHQHAQQVPNNS